MTTGCSQMLTPNNLAGSINKTAFTKQLKMIDENLTNKTEFLNVDDQLLRNTMSQLEATRLKNKNLSNQKKFVKKALANLTNELCENKEKPMTIKIDTQPSISPRIFQTNDIPNTPNDF